VRKLGDESVATDNKMRVAFRMINKHIIYMKMAMEKIVVSDPEILGGTPVFAGTRVPFQNLIDCLEAGDSIDLFLYDFPTVSREQVIAVLEVARERLLSLVA